MDALSRALEHTLRHNKLPDSPALRQDQQFVLPFYDGLCLSNIVPTVASLLGAEVPGWRSLDRRLWADLSTGVRRVVMIVLDAVGHRQLQRWVKGAPDSLFARLAEQGRLAPITSVFPSTTTAALSSLWTGRPPLAHGLIGYELFLKQWGVVANMIFFSPAHDEGLGVLLDWGLQTASFLAVPTAAQLLAPCGITSRTLIRSAFLGSPLSQMFYQGVDELAGHLVASDLWVNLRRMLQHHRDERLFLTAYWGGVDSILHHYGPGSEQWVAEMRSLAYSIEHEFLRPLSAVDRAGTLLLITADHGQIRVPAERVIRLDQHPALARNLVVQPCGDPRAAYLYVRPGRLTEVRSYLDNELGHAFVTVPAAEALQGGLFGQGPAAPDVEDRAGDLVLLAREDYMLYGQDKEPTLAGRHGGLHAEEMLVPLFLVRLDDLALP